MADTSEESPAQKQARLRREKRNARIASEGNDRLAKITGVSGRAPPVPAKEPTPQQFSASTADDPEEVDISEHHWDPSEGRLPARITQKPLPRTPMGDAAPDPMMQMMQQMTASMPGGPGQIGGGAAGGTGNDGSSSPFPNNSPFNASGAPPMDGLPPFLQAMLAGQQRTSAQAQAQPPPSDSAYVWRVVHAVLALALAGYIVATTSFTGTKLARFADDSEADAGKRLFYIFATVETVLQSSRYFLEGGRLSGKGWLATIANSGMVPEPFGGYLRVAGRYAAIWTTLVADATTVVFVLGAVAWWRNLGVA